MTGYVTRNGRQIEVESLETGATSRRRSNPFVKVPLDFATRATKATNTSKAMVWLWLLYQAWKTKTNTVVLPNGQLGSHSVSRKTKVRALHELEAGGLITVEWRPRKSPVVTLNR